VTWGKRLYFPSEGRYAEDFFTRKIRRIRPGLNPRTWVPEASKLVASNVNLLPLYWDPTQYTHLTYIAGQVTVDWDGDGCVAEKWFYYLNYILLC
jgi:hypothetical protein